MREPRFSGSPAFALVVTFYALVAPNIYLSQDDTVRIAGSTPPPRAYFSFQTMLFARYNPATGGGQAFDDFEKSVQAADVLRVFRVQPKTELSHDPLPAPVLRVRGTGHAGMDLNPTMQKRSQAILAHRNAKGFNAEELDKFMPASIPEGGLAVQREVDDRGPGRDGSAGYGGDANHPVSSWFDLTNNSFAIVFGVDRAATGTETAAGASVYLGGKIAADGPPIAANAPVRIGFRQYAEPATRVGPADTDLLCERAIVFRPPEERGDACAFRDAGFDRSARSNKKT